MTTIFDRISCGEIGNDAIPVNGRLDNAGCNSQRGEQDRCEHGNGGNGSVHHFGNVDIRGPWGHEGWLSQWHGPELSPMPKMPWHDMLGIPHCMSEATYPRVAEQIQCNMKAIVYYSGILAIEYYWMLLILQLWWDQKFWAQKRSQRDNPLRSSRFAGPWRWSQRCWSVWSPKAPWGTLGDRGAGVVPWNYVELLVPSRGRLNSCYESHQYQSRSRAEEGTIYGSGGTGGMWGVHLECKKSSVTFSVSVWQFFVTYHDVVWRNAETTWNNMKQHETTIRPLQAVAIIPRGQRATDLLNVSCGTQSISPLHLGTQNSWVTKDIKWILNGY